MKTLKTVADVMEELGGLRPVAELTGCKYTTVSMWKTLDRFPANKFLMMSSILRSRGYTAPPSLWGQSAETVA